MKPAIIYAAAIVAFSAPLAASAALGQTPAQNELPQTERTFNLTLEQRHTIKEILKDAKVEKASGDMAVSAGAAVPANVALHDMPAVIAEKVPQIKSHQFFLTGDKIVIVDPTAKKVAEVIE